MSTASTAEYEGIRGAIQQNIAVIRSLLDQVDALNSITLNIDDTAVKEKLEENVDSLYKSIENLIKQTNNLFDECIRLADMRTPDKVPA